MDLSRTVSEINDDFSRKSQKKFPTPEYFAPPLKGFPEIGYRRMEAKKLEQWSYRVEKEVWRFGG